MSNRDRFAAAMAALPLVAILRGVKPEEVVGIARAVAAAGIRILEVPLNSPRPLESLALLAAAEDEFPPEMIFGAGTVLTPADVDQVADRGGRLVVSPNFSAPVVERTGRHGLVSAPGVATPTEAFAALGAGADALKLFPGELIAPPVVKAMRAVLPKATRLLVVGGVGPDTMGAYVTAGADGFGLGSSLYAPGLDATAVGARAEAAVAAARAAGLGKSA